MKSPLRIATRRCGMSTSPIIELEPSIQYLSYAQREFGLRDGFLQQIDAVVQSALVNDRIARVSGHVCRRLGKSRDIHQLRDARDAEIFVEFVSFLEATAIRGRACNGSGRRKGAPAAELRDLTQGD
jgi:3-methyladenine DNA glycosylase/8-oxoguanine DNA glycosylase